MGFTRRGGRRTKIRPRHSPKNVGASPQGQTSANTILVGSDDQSVVSSLDADWSSMRSEEEATPVDNSSTQDSGEEVVIALPDPNTEASTEEKAIMVEKTHEHLNSAVRIWLSDAHSLARSEEMASFVSSSRDVVLVVGGIACQTMLLPVTVPLRVVSVSTGAVIGTCQHVVACAGSVIEQVTQPRGGESSSSSSPIEGVVQNVSKVVPLVFHVVGKAKDEIIASLLQFVSPEMNTTRRQERDRRYTTSSGESSSEQESFLDRLRLDYDSPKPAEESDMDDEQPEASADDEGASRTQSGPTSSDYSKYLLRVGDLGMVVEDSSSSPVLYIDLCQEFGDDTLTQQALDKLASGGLSIAASNPKAGVIADVDSSFGMVSWKPEKSTGELLRKQARLSPEEWRTCMESELLLFSGRFVGRGVHSPSPLFLARGTVKRSPRDFLELLWDNSRTEEYNNYCLGRSDLIATDDKVLAGASRGTKVVKSETRVPYTNFSVILSTLMHVRPLEEPDGGYVIISRSLDAGMAGTHFDSSAKVETGVKNEIFWGVNILRPVPGNPYHTDLISVSQAASSLIPSFLAYRIGTMGVEDFFSNVRES